MEDKTDSNSITRTCFHISNKTVIPGSDETTNLILTTGFMVYMFWAYVYDDGNAAPETVNSDGQWQYNIGFVDMALSFFSGNINDFGNYKADTTIPSETWTHCAVVLEFASGSFKIYYNGIEQPVTNNVHSNINGGPFNVKIGSYGVEYDDNIPIYINNLFINNDAMSFTHAQLIVQNHYDQIL